MNESNKPLRDRIGRRLLNRVLIFSLLLTVLFTFFQALIDYNKRIAAVNETMAQIERTQIDGIVEALWNYDRRELSLIVDGILHFPYINYAVVCDDEGVVAEAGKRGQHDSIALEHPLSREENGRRIRVGTLYFQASSAEVIHEVFNRILVIFLFQALTVSIIAFMFFMLFKRMVTRHLFMAAGYLRSFDTVNLDKPLQLDKVHCSDEIDTLVDAFNLTREKLGEAYRQLLSSQQRIRESEERFRVLVEQAPEAILVYDIEKNRYVDANFNAMRLYNCSRTELLECPPERFFSPIQPDGHDVSESKREYVQRALAGKEVVFERALCGAQGRELLCEVRLVRMPSAEGRLIRVSLIDITERKRVEAALRESEAKYRVLVESSFFAIYIIQDGLFRFVNKRFCEMYGYAYEELVDKLSPVALTYSEDREIVSENLIKRLSGEFESIHYSVRGLRKDATAFITDTFGSSIIYKGRPAILGTSIDVTEKRQAEEEVRRLHRLLSNIINSMPSILVAVDSECKITQWSREAEKATGIKASEAVDRQLSLVYPYLAAKMSKILDAIRLRQVQAELRLSFKSEGELRYHDMTVYPLIANGIEGAVIRLDDVTERVRLEEMLVQSEKMLSVGGLAAGMAHEINNPLAGIIQNAQVMHNRLATNLQRNVRVAQECGTTMEVIHNYMEKREIMPMLSAVVEAGRRAATIVENMLSFSRKSESRFVLQNLAELLDKTIHLAESDYDMKKKYDFRQVSIVREYQEGMPLVSCEPTKIQQVVLNLLKNGAQAMAGMKDRAAQFTIRLYTEGDMACLEVEDNGPGMDQETRKRVFEPFFTTKEIGVGTGLGLSVAYFIITENHGGSIEVESEPGCGARFIIRLPMRRSEP